MHSGELAQLAVVVSSAADELIHRPRPFAVKGIHRYWTASQCRLDRWGAALHQLTSQPRQAAATGDLPSLLEEILVSDLLTRAWTAVAIAHDRARHDVDNGGDFEPAARSILESHEEARQRALHLILDIAALRADQATSLNRLRQRVERWTNMLVAHLLVELPHPAIAQVAFDPQGAAQTASHIAPYRDDAQRVGAWETIRVSVVSALRRPLTKPAQAELNTQIAAAILACLGPAFADSPALPEPFWRLRMENATSDMHTMLDELLALESTREPSQGPPSAS